MRISQIITRTEIEGAESARSPEAPFLEENQSLGIKKKVISKIFVCTWSRMLFYHSVLCLCLNINICILSMANICSVSILYARGVVLLLIKRLIEALLNCQFISFFSPLENNIALYRWKGSNWYVVHYSIRCFDLDSVGFDDSVCLWLIIIIGMKFLSLLLLSVINVKGTRRHRNKLM